MPCEAVRARRPALRIAAHCHGRRGMGPANAQAALDAGIDRFGAAREHRGLVGHEVPGQVLEAGPCDRRDAWPHGGPHGGPH